MAPSASAGRSEAARCEACKGSGKAKNPRYIMELPCPRCRGKGTIDADAKRERTPAKED